MAYDLYFTNPGASYMKFQGPGYIETDSASENLNLTLRAANEGKVIVDDMFAVTGNMGIGSTTPGAMFSIQSPVCDEYADT